MVKYPPTVDVDKFIDCENSINTNCDITGYWLKANNPSYPINYNNVYEFSADGRFMHQHGAVYGYLYNKDCGVIDIRTSPSNKKVGELIIKSFNDKIMIIENDQLCPTGDCIFIRLQNSNREKLELYANFLYGCENNCHLNSECNDQTSGFKCINDHSWIDFPDQLEILSVKQVSEDRYVVLTKFILVSEIEHHLFYVDKNLNIIWNLGFEKEIEMYNPNALPNIITNDENFIYILRKERKSNYLFSKIDFNGNIIIKDKVVNIPDNIGSVATYSIVTNRDYIYCAIRDNYTLLGKLDKDGNLINLVELPFSYELQVHLNLHPFKDNLVLFSDQSSYDEIFEFDQNLNLVRRKKFQDFSNFSDFDLGNRNILAADVENDLIIIETNLFGDPDDSKSLTNLPFGYLVNNDLNLSDLLRTYRGVNGNSVKTTNITDNYVVNLFEDVNPWLAIYEINNDELKFKFNFEIDLDNNFYSSFDPKISFETDEGILVLGNGRTITNTIVGYHFKFNSLYPEITCN